jgi:hypothetical protein
MAPARHKQIGDQRGHDGIRQGNVIGPAGVQINAGPPDLIARGVLNSD